MIALNYRVAKLDARQRAMLDFAWKLTMTPYLVDDADRDALRAAGLSEGGYFRSGGDGGLLQSVEPDGLGDRHDAQSGVSSAGSLTCPPKRRKRLASMRGTK
ncbi:MAG: hypothetical protein WDN69_08910 [Aliidongia sp.]